jgi:transglutaminase-like putative cysteine protease
VSTSSELSDYLSPTRFIDSDHPEVIALASATAAGAADQVDAAVALYYRVRDGLR